MELQEILTEGRFDTWKGWVERLAECHEIKVLRGPETCLLMVEAQESVNESTFHPGEVLLTEAVVSVNNQIGYGFALEDEPARALCFAVIEAALAAEVNEIPELRQALETEAVWIQQQRQLETALVERTRVRFSIMEG